MKLYHRTSQAEAQAILSTRMWRSLESPARVYFSTRSDGQAEGYGAVVLEVTVPEALAELDDEFPDGERHYAVPVAALNGRTVTVVSGMAGE